MKTPWFDHRCFECGEELTDKPHYCKPQEQRPKKKPRKRGFVRRFNDGSKNFEDE